MVEQVLISLLVTLSLGAYVYTYFQSRDLYREIKDVRDRLDNHYEHRLTELEDRVASLSRSVENRDRAS